MHAEIKYGLSVVMHGHGSVLTQGIRGWRLTAEVRVQVRISCEKHGGRNDTVAGFPSRFFDFLSTIVIPPLPKTFHHPPSVAR
jgi:hypothetical protein